MSDAAEPAPLDPKKLVLATLSDPGRVRPENQDAVTALVNVSNERLVVVADGMGGHRGGETASKLAIDTLGRIFREPHGTPEERLRRGLELANEEVYSHALSNPDLKGMGTTAVALLFGPGTRGVWLAWVGDSRCYRLRDGALEALTRDHSLMAEWIEIGVIAPEDVETHPRRHELTRAIGQAPDVSVDVARVDLRAGDRFLLCSDGVHALVQERALKAVLTGHSAEETASLLIERANSAGGSDNATVAIVDVPAEAITPDAVEQAPELPLELELPSPPPQLAQLPPDESMKFELEPTGHQSAAIDAALAELEAARSAAPATPAAPPASLEASASDLSLVFETRAALSAPAPAAAPAAPAPAAASAEESFADLLGDDAPVEARAEPPREEFGGPLLAAPPLDSPSLVAPTPQRPIQIPLMTPVRARRGLHGPSIVAGLATGAAVVALAAAGFLYTGVLQPMSAPRPVVAVPVPLRALPLQPIPQRRIPTQPLPLPQQPVQPAPARPVRPVPRPEPAVVAREVTPPSPPAPAAPAPAVTPARAAQPAPAPAPIPVPDAPRPGPTTVVIVRPQSPTASSAVPAAPDPSATAALPSSAGFELPAPVHRFVDDWLRAQATHDAALYTSLGFHDLPAELAGTWATRDAFRLKAASIDEERSSAERVYLRVVLSYAFRDPTGRFRTEDESRMILHLGADGSLHFEGRWQQ